MNYGIQISASGALASIHQQDALSANLANINTAGFKPVLAGTMFREAARQEDGLMNMPSDALLERLGGGVFAAPTIIDFTQGTLDLTGNTLDLAIQGDGFFGVGDPSNPSLTRDGRFTLNSEGVLVMSSNGTPVLSEDGGEIKLDLNYEIEIDSQGVIYQGGAEVDRLMIADVADRSVLKKHGHGQFVSKYGQPLDLIGAVGLVKQGAIEESAVNEVDALMKITAASRAAQGNIGMIQMQNSLNDRAINTFGRIS
ncbi:MAG: flagellar hook basal-body protein [Phycisphaerales bacterium]|nr:flagellar hook basal-body protein [Phycisphaerales bacterium]